MHRGISATARPKSVCWVVCGCVLGGGRGAENGEKELVQLGFVLETLVVLLEVLGASVGLVFVTCGQPEVAQHWNVTRKVDCLHSVVAIEGHLHVNWHPHLH